MSELTADEIVDLCLRHTLYDWQQQGSTRPVAVASARGSEFFTVDGKRYLDFNSQLMGVNIGHADPRVAYPFYLGHADETGSGAGAGYTMNIPLAPGCGSGCDTCKACADPAPAPDGARRVIKIHKS